MMEFKKLDEKDLAVSDRKLTAREEKEFSAFLKSRKVSSKKDAGIKAAH
ncbi:hypothetical protein [Dyadobacter sp. 50-39]|jgi:hypothetical protein|nr:hypothetical protein [Dyadobacter sp. 50-39]